MHSFQVRSSFVRQKNFSQTQFKNTGILPYSEAFEQVSGKFCLPKPFIPIWLKPKLTAENQVHSDCLFQP